MGGGHRGGSARPRAFRSPVPRASRCGVQNLLRLNFRLDKAGRNLARCVPFVKKVLRRCVQSEKAVDPRHCARAIVPSPRVLRRGAVHLGSGKGVSVKGATDEEVHSTSPWPGVLLDESRRGSEVVDWGGGFPVREHYEQGGSHG